MKSCNIEEFNTYLLQFSLSNHSVGYAIVTAKSPSKAEEILKAMGRADGDYSVTSIQNMRVYPTEGNTILHEGISSCGYSAYEIAVQQGFDGSEEEWIASLKGEKGDTGNVDFNQLTEDQVTQITQPALDLMNSWKNAGELKGDPGTTDYNELANKPYIPTKVSDLTNDSGYVDSTYHDDTKVDKVTGASLVEDTKISSYDSHLVNTDNPHSVTKEQVGLGNVDNTSDINKPISTATQTALDTKVDKVSGKSLLSDATKTDYDNHLINTSNPHSVTKAQIGLNNVVNTGDSDTPVSGGTTKFTTGGAYTELAKKVDKVEGSSLVADTKVASYDSHLTDTSNPHNVTKVQVGLGNVDNTSDINKPISTATQSALNNKVDKESGKGLFGGSYNDLTDKPVIPSGEAADKDVDTSINNGSTSVNLPTSAAVAAFVEGKNYKTENTTYTLSQDATDGHKITLTPSSGDATTITIPDNDTVTTVESTGSGNAITALTATNGAISASKAKTFVESSEKGTANGVASLDENGLIISSQLPAYVDDVLEYADKNSFPSSGEAGKIYVDTSTNLTYRWSGTTYTEISASLALGETSSTAYAGDKGKAISDTLESLGLSVVNGQLCITY